MTGEELGRMEAVLQELFLSEKYDEWREALGPYSDALEEAGEGDRAELCRSVVGMMDIKGEWDIPIILDYRPAKELADGNTFISERAFGFPERTVYVSSYIPRAVKVSLRRTTPRQFMQYGKRLPQVTVGKLLEARRRKRESARA